MSLILGIATIVGIRLSKKWFPLFPTPVLVMVIGVLMTKYGRLARTGVQILPWVRSGLPPLPAPRLDGAELPDLLFVTLSIAVVIMSETLLASKNEEIKHGNRLRENPEVLAYSLANLAAFAVGCLPVNGSISRTGLAKQYGAKSQLMSVVSALVILIVLLNFTWIVGYMPVCMLTAIVISALMNACEFGLAAKLYKSNKEEFYIFVSAFLSVLVFGTVYGVAIGVFLSFVAVTIRATAPPRIFQGVIEGEEDFHNLARHDDAYPIRGTVLYKFGGNLFFANVDKFQEDIEAAVTPEIKQVIINAGGMADIDLTAAERLLLIYRTLKARDVRMFIVAHMDSFEDKLIAYDAQELIEEGVLKKTTAQALSACGLNPPYPLVKAKENKSGKKKKQKK